MRARLPHRLSWLSWGVALPVLFLSLIGLLTIRVTDPALRANAVTQLRADSDETSASAAWPARVLDFAGPLATRQTLYLLSGVGLLLLTILPSYQRLGGYASLAYGCVIVLLALLVVDRFVDLPLIPVRRDTRRWIQFSSFFTIQPSEFMKPVLVLTLARYLRYRASFRRWRGLIPPFLLTLVPMFLILFEPDLGTVLMLLPVLFALLFVAGARRRHLLLLIAAGGTLLPIFYKFGMADYQRLRFQVLLRQGTPDERWHLGPGYQLRQSKVALGSGGLAGAGYGRGLFVHHSLLPDAHNDFIFAIIGHQWGLVGCLAVIVAYIVLVFCGIEIVFATNDPFGRLLAVGVTTMIVVQAFLNIGMTLGLTPITGMTLPFVSAGGSSLWANFVALGLLVNVAQRRPMLIGHPPFEHPDE